MESLPFIDEHAVQVDASPELIWSSLVGTLRRTMGGSAAFARALGCEPARSSERFDGNIGQTLPGFRVVEAEPGRRLTLEGRHRFSSYRLTFILDDDRVRARTNAAFPGVLGRLYRTAVIGTRAHALITRRLLRRITRYATA
jgi:hypothetical protein